MKYHSSWFTTSVSEEPNHATTTVLIVRRKDEG